jgi:hypothetical protein
MKKALICFLISLSISSVAAQNMKISGKFVISAIAKYIDGNKDMEIDIASSGECPFYYNFLEEGKFVESGFEDEDCKEEISTSGIFIVSGNLLLIRLEEDVQRYTIESNSANTLILSYTEEESQGFGGIKEVKYRYTFKKN